MGLYHQGSERYRRYFVLTLFAGDNDEIHTRVLRRVNITTKPGLYDLRACDIERDSFVRLYQSSSFIKGPRRRSAVEHIRALYSDRRTSGAEQQRPGRAASHCQSAGRPAGA